MAKMVRRRCSSRMILFMLVVAMVVFIPYREAAARVRVYVYFAGGTACAGFVFYICYRFGTNGLVDSDGIGYGGPLLHLSGNRRFRFSIPEVRVFPDAAGLVEKEERSTPAIYMEIFRFSF